MRSKNEWLNLPNALTMLRILLIPCLIIAFFKESGARRTLSLIFFLTAGLTDCLDGYLARRLHQVTSLGKVLDPLADKLLTAAMLFCLAWSGVIDWLLLGVIVFKELYMAVGAVLCLKRKLEVASDIYGKIATVLFYPAVLLAWPWHGAGWVTIAGVVLLYASVGASLVAAVHYTLDSVKKSNGLSAH